MRIEPVTALLKFSVAIFLGFLASIASADGHNSLIQTVARIAGEMEAQAGFAAYNLESGQRWGY